MRIISKRVLREFTQDNPTIADALNDWCQKTLMADWANFAEVKQTFSTADYVGDHRVVFNIKGNHFRLVAIILFHSEKLHGQVLIRFIGTHGEYDKIDCNLV